jgi:hypothetical protein
VGGVYFTSNGGASWIQQFSGGNQNPNKIYMYNARIGFMSNSSALPNIYKTTNGGGSWTVNLPGENFTDMHFVDSLIGWKCGAGYDTSMKKTTDCGISWHKQYLPSNVSNIAGIVSFSVINKDTLIGVGGSIVFPNFQVRGILFKTLNGGFNWGYQIPDTTIHIQGGYNIIKFISKNIGWAFNTGYNPVTGIHTINGGDTTIIYGIKKISNNIPKNFKLFQNFPNPFNPVTNLRFEISELRFIKIKIYDLLGKEISILFNKKLSPGEYEIQWDGTYFSSGIYFYSLYVSNQLIDTKKLILLK